MQFRADQKMTPSPDVLFREVCGESVLLDLSSENYFGLNEVGTRIWQLLQSGFSVGDTVDALTREFEVQRVTAESDLDELLGRLVQAGLVKM